MKFFKRFFLLCSVLTAVQCIQFNSNKVKGNREVSSKTVKVDSTFNELEVSGGWEVQLIRHHSNEVILQADRNLLNYLMVNQSDMRLSIGANKTIGYAKEKLVKVYFKDNLKLIKAQNEVEVFSEEKLYFESIEFDASSNAEIELELEAESIEIKGSSDCDVSLETLSKNLTILGSSSADIEVDGDNKDVIVKASSDSDITLKGTGDTADYEATSSAKIDAKRFKVKNIVANASSSGEIKCYPVDDLEANATNDGEISYHNDPSNNINSKAKSGGTIKRK